MGEFRQTLEAAASLFGVWLSVWLGSFGAVFAVSSIRLRHRSKPIKGRRMSSTGLQLEDQISLSRAVAQGASSATMEDAWRRSLGGRQFPFGASLIFPDPSPEVSERQVELFGARTPFGYRFAQPLPDLDGSVPIPMMGHTHKITRLHSITGFAYSKYVFYRRD